MAQSAIFNRRLGDGPLIRAAVIDPKLITRLSLSAGCTRQEGSRGTDGDGPEVVGKSDKELWFQQGRSRAR